MPAAAAALLKLRIARPDLVAWLDARPVGTTGWSDWREIGGAWPFPDECALRAIPEDELADTLARCDARLRRLATNRIALRALLDTAEEPRLKRASFDDAAGEFVAASLTYADTVTSVIVFFALARSAADHLGPDGYGVALVHDYLSADPSAEATRAAMRLGPGGETSFLAEGERGSAAGAFDAIAQAMKADGAAVVDQLDGLR